ncbi:MAG: glycosyltransferase family 2 protein [Candidatus Doudnabacteria bacterium]|nr:glycosyltransferase family 2 protein [Candidatus Doudnabacteria bacterium]
MISFIIPAKNEEGYIGGCLHSIMTQDLPEGFEIVVVDNNSADHTRETVLAVCPKAIIFKEERCGTSAARQRGFLEAKGELLIFLDADVRLPDNLWLKRVVKKVSRPKAVALSSHYRYYGLPFYKSILQLVGNFIFVYPWIFFVSKLLRYSTHMIGGMMVIKKSALIKAGGFDISVEFFGDEALIAKKLYSVGHVHVSPKLWVWTSARRFKEQGMLKTVFSYVFNYFWVFFSGKPYHSSAYKQYR